jgi:hypothetical protein
VVLIKATGEAAAPMAVAPRERTAAGEAYVEGEGSG